MLRGGTFFGFGPPRTQKSQQLASGNWLLAAFGLSIKISPLITIIPLIHTDVWVSFRGEARLA